MKLLCKLGFHFWSLWEQHPYQGNWVTRHCLKCYRLEDKRLF